MNLLFLMVTFFSIISFSSVKANLAYITNEKDNTVSVIDIKKKKLLKPSRLAKDLEESLCPRMENLFLYVHQMMIELK